MDAEFERLIAEFPRVYGKLRGGQFECGPGWAGILREFAEKANDLVEETDFVIVKDKFGGLRLQGFKGPPALHELVRIAESQADKACQECGNPVKSNTWGSGGSYCAACKSGSKPCVACDGSGYYDNDGSPPCGACDGTGVE